MARHPLAGKPAPVEYLVDLAGLERAYYEERPDPEELQQRVFFGTSGHRGTPLHRTFNEAHILAITQAICEYRQANGIGGPLFLGKDTHALSSPAERTALEVLAANGVETIIQRGGGATPTPVISHAILTHQRDHAGVAADGIVITPSHNPPEDGGFKYNPPHGGPADSNVTSWIQRRANEHLCEENRHVRRQTYEHALHAATTHPRDLLAAYVAELGEVIDFEPIRSEGLHLGVDPLGGASLAYWEPIALRYGLRLEVVNQSLDPAFGFMTLDHDGKIRMDCSSPDAMANLVGLRGHFDVAFGNDPDADRHGIVTRSAGLMNPNHYLATAIQYLVTHRPGWAADAAIGKTVVSSSIINRVVDALGRRLAEVPVGFKWFSAGLLSGEYCFGGEESAGASFLRRNGQVWVTDKDGILLNLLAAEMTAVTNRDPGELYRAITEQFGAPCYRRVDAPASPEEKARFAHLNAASVKAVSLAGDPITHTRTHAPGNGQPIGGLKVETKNGWFAARPSGTENIYKIYAESFLGEQHLDELIAEAKELVTRTLHA